MNILIVDDEKDCCNDLADFLSSFPHCIDKAYGAEEAIEKNRKKNFNLVISDVNMPKMNGIELALFLRSLPQKPEVVLISGKNEIIESINSIDLGVLDVMTKPVNLFDLSELIHSLEQKLKEDEKLKKEREIQSTAQESGITDLEKYRPKKDFSIDNPEIGKIGIYSEKMFQIYNKLRKLSEFKEIPILLEGPTGTGKEVLAKYIHYQNPNTYGPFIAVNCANLGRELFEAELFGYEKGSFTGADTKGREGKIKLAENGTLFLDEITEIPLDLQVKLLRVIQEREYYKIGGNQKLKVNTRLIFATNKNILETVQKGLFREDLYYRLNICPVIIPPLSGRKEEIIPLIIHFIRESSVLMKKNIKGIDSNLLKKMENLTWKGNIRELRNICTKAVLFCESEILKKEDFDMVLLKETENISIDPEHFEIPETPFDLEELNKMIVKKTLLKFNGNKSKTAEFLGLTRIQLYRRFKIED